MESPDRQLPPFWSLVEEYGDELMGHARRLVPHAAEDVLHDALLKALRHYPALSDGSHLRAWLYRVTTTTAFDHSARRSRRREVITDRVPENGAYDAELDGFEDLIGDLPDNARSVLRMRFVDDLSYPDMAEALGCSEVAARQRVSSAVRSMRRRLT